MTGWQFWIDRGGTFTDIVARRPDGEVITHKLLSDAPSHYDDAALAGICDLLGVPRRGAVPSDRIDAVKMGTTVATNALLERRGERTLLAITRGFGDALRIGYQDRPRLFDLRISLPDQLYEDVLEIDERVSVEGTVLRPLDEAGSRAGLAAARSRGIDSVAIVLMHGYRHTAHETRVAEWAREAGFRQISVSHVVSPLMKLVGRGDTTVVDAYLTPILRRYVDRLAGRLAGSRLMFMQSNGGLTDAQRFQGKDSVLSGPAGGIVGMVRTSEAAGFDRIIGFDMGGTSTDVSHYAGTLEREFDTKVAGVRLRAPMLAIHTVAAGGGSILEFDGARFRVGPHSAGANPGPACYRNGGPLTVTDCNVMLGKIQPEWFPHVFGPDGDQPLDVEAATRGFSLLAARISQVTGRQQSAEEVAEGFLAVAIDNMANAIKKISVQRGYDITGYTLCCFGGAGGQHACLVADALAIPRIFIHPLAGVLSAYGMGLADLRVLKERSLELPLSAENKGKLAAALADLADEARQSLLSQGVDGNSVTVQRRVHLRSQGSDSALILPFADLDGLRTAFHAEYARRYGFAPLDRPLVIEMVSVEAVGGSGSDPAPLCGGETDDAQAPAGEKVSSIRMWSAGRAHGAPVFIRQKLLPGQHVDGPAVIAEANATTIVEPGWCARVDGARNLILERFQPRPQRVAIGTSADPVMLEIFNNLFMSIAEQMGATLANTAHSVNIKERLDFSCAVFDPDGNLVANAPHIPVHLGSMGDSIRRVIDGNAGRIRPGDVYVVNDPYHGGTHLPDVTVITPVFDADGGHILFYVGSRGHHADIGGIAPGSMPPDSRSIAEEGVLFDNELLVRDGQFREAEVRAILASGQWPARNPEQNLLDLHAQIAANEKGVSELRRMVEQFGLDVVRAYMRHVQDNAEEAVRRTITRLRDGTFAYEMDDGAVVRVAITVDHAARSARIDFTGTSPQRDNNFNAPSAVCKAAVLYVFRTLIEDDIPLNAGCLKPLDIVIPKGSMLDPLPPAAVVAGNVEVSQCVTDALYGALGIMGAAQGTMNNFTFGNARHQYYETVCGGTGAGAGFDGTSAVQSHMTNSRLTDPEVLESRFPVLLESFALRRGSGGDGQFRGGDGVIRRLRFREKMTAAILSNRRRVAPYGMADGEPAAVGQNRVERADGRVVDLGAFGLVDMEPGDVFVIETPGGGGFGPVESKASGQ